MPKLILQPPNSSLCGQCCVAMVTGKALSTVIRAMGDTSTTTRAVYHGLKFFGINCSDKLKIIRKNTILPKKAILNLSHPTQDHWMLWCNGKIYDPAGHYPNGYNGYRITSFLEIYGRKPKSK